MVTTMWRHELTLISQTYIEDDIGNRVPVEAHNTIFCDIKSVKSSEFYSAANTGLKPEVVFIIYSFEYEGETAILYDNKKYRVIRTYQKTEDELELICERVING